MIELKSFPQVSVAKIGVLLTFIVSLAACSHESLRVDNSPLPPAELAANTTTPEPLSEAQSALASRPAPHSATRSHRHHSHQAKLNRHAGEQRFAHHHGIPHESVAAVGKIKDKSELNGPNSLSAGLTGDPTLMAPPAIAQVEQSGPDASLINRVEQLKQSWAFGLVAIILVSGALLWVAMYRTSARRKSRRLVFNA